MIEIHRIQERLGRSNDRNPLNLRFFVEKIETFVENSH